MRRTGRLIRRVLSRCSRTVDGHLSRNCVAAALQRSTRGLGEQPRRPLSDLAPGEVYLAGRSPEPLVVSYTTVSPLPRSHLAVTTVAVCSLLHCLAGCPGWVLPTALLCGARTFLGGPGGPVPTRPSCRPVRPFSLPASGRATRAAAEDGQMPDSCVRTSTALLSGQSRTSSGAADRTVARSFPVSSTPLALETRARRCDAPTP